MTETLAPVIRLPLPRIGRPGDRIRCTPTPPDGCFDLKTLLVCSTAFWQRGAHSRRYSNVVRDLRRLMDEGNMEEGEPLDPSNHASARRWVDQAIAARNTPLSVVAS
ncbi:MAG: hypothetical protein ACYDDU_20240 [Dermatophilaceae bacterium]